MIVFNNVSKQFFNDTYGVKDVSLEIDPGELVVITGQTGSGKTTLMRLLTRESSPSEGEITFEEQSLNDLPPSLIPHHRRRVGVIFQDYRLLPESNVWENVALPLLIANKPESEIEDRVTDLLELVGLEEKAELFPRELSGGEAQRVGIARALATAPPVIFADEPTGNLDQETAKKIVGLLQKIHKLGTTVLIATHDVTVLKELSGARNLELKDGQLIKDTGDKKPKKKKKKEEKEPEPVEPTEEPEEVEIENLDDDDQKDNKKEAKQDKKKDKQKK